MTTLYNTKLLTLNAKSDALYFMHKNNTKKEYIELLQNEFNVLKTQFETEYNCVFISLLDNVKSEYISVNEKSLLSEAVATNVPQFATGFNSNDLGMQYNACIDIARIFKEIKYDKSIISILINRFTNLLRIQKHVQQNTDGSITQIILADSLL